MAATLDCFYNYCSHKRIALEKRQRETKSFLKDDVTYCTNICQSLPSLHSMAGSHRWEGLTTFTENLTTKCYYRY